MSSKHYGLEAQQDHGGVKRIVTLRLASSRDLHQWIAMITGEKLHATLLGRLAGLVLPRKLSQALKRP